MRETLLADIGEGRNGVSGEDSAAVVRRTNAFALNPDQFFVCLVPSSTLRQAFSKASIDVLVPHSTGTV